MTSFVELLSSKHARQNFDCGEEDLNRFLREQARQNADRHLGVTRVVVAQPGDTTIQGYYTLVTRTVTSSSLPAPPRLPLGELGVVLLGRLAVDQQFQRQQLGQRTLLRAMAETAQAAQLVGIHALVLDCLNEKARNWYLHLKFGLAPVLDDPNRLFVPVSLLQKLDLGSLDNKL